MARFISSGQGPAGTRMGLLTANGPSNPYSAELKDVTSTDVVNLSNAPGATVTDALNNLTPSTGTDWGFLSRRVFVNAASSKVGAMVGPTMAEAAITITTAAQLGPGRLFQVTCIPASPGAGAGDAAGSSGSCFGGLGAGGVARAQQIFTRAQLIAALPIAITAPLAGAGAPAVVNSSGTPAGSALAGDTSSPFAAFGTLLRAYRGGRGRGRQNTGTTASGAAGGGLMGVGQDATGGIGANTIGGDPVGGVTASDPSSSLGGGSSFQGVSGMSYWGGAAAGSTGTLTSSQVPGGNSGKAGGGGGMGGRAVGGAPNTSAVAGGDSGPIPGGAPGGVGQPGADGADSDWPENSTGGSGGGGAPAGGANATASRGGNGGFPGGAPGGGGAASATSGSGTSGKGGDGADGCVVLVAVA